MFHVVPNLLGREDIAWLLTHLKRLRWEEGRLTAGQHLHEAKRNRQLSRAEQDLQPLEQKVFDAVRGSRDLLRFARPSRFGVLLFNRYGVGESYGSHFDDPIMRLGPGFRTDVSFTVFLSRLNDYDGGELVMELGAAEQPFRLEAGSVVLYPANLRHRVEPVTRGERIAAVGWIQSRVRDPLEREILADLEQARENLLASDPQDSTRELVEKAFYALARKWSDA